MSQKPSQHPNKAQTINRVPGGTQKVRMQPKKAETDEVEQMVNDDEAESVNPHQRMSWVIKKPCVHGFIRLAASIDSIDQAEKPS